MSLSGFLESLPPSIVGLSIGIGLVKARERGRWQWISLVGRPPRDLFADRKFNFFLNAVYEWAWIGFSVWILACVMFFIDATDGFAEFVFYLGTAMILIRVIAVPWCVAYAQLNPKYKDQVTASPA